MPKSRILGWLSIVYYFWQKRDRLQAGEFFPAPGNAFRFAMPVWVRGIRSCMRRDPLDAQWKMSQHFVGDTIERMSVAGSLDQLSWSTAHHTGGDFCKAWGLSERWPLCEMGDSSERTETKGPSPALGYPHPPLWLWESSFPKFYLVLLKHKKILWLKKIERKESIFFLLLLVAYIEPKN